LVAQTARFKQLFQNTYSTASVGINSLGLAGTKDTGQKERLKRQVHFPTNSFSFKCARVFPANMGVR